jgi:flagellar hook-associated protein FlgK
MGIGAAQEAALSGLRVNQHAFSVIARNIANVNNENYTRKIVEQRASMIEGQGVGVEVASIKRTIDQALQGELRNQDASHGYVSTINEYNQKIQILFGNPNSNSNLNSSISEFFSAVESLAAKPELTSLKLNAVQKGSALANQISNLVNDLNTLRYDADHAIAESFNIVNAAIKNIQIVDLQIVQTGFSGGDTSALLDQRDAELAIITNLMEISMYQKSNGSISISAANGIALLDSSPYQILYEPATTINAFINNDPLNAAIVSPSFNDGTISTQKSKLMTGGKHDEIINKLKNGKITALQQLRDVDIIKTIEQLDNLAVAIRDKVNAIHNSGAGNPPISNMTGSRELLHNEYHNYTGKVMINAVKADGNAIIRDDGSMMPPLILDLEKLNSGSGPSTVHTQTIIDEINQYFYKDTVGTHIEVGNLRDVRIASTSDTIAANGTFNFDFELVNESNLDSIFEVTAIAVEDSLGASVAGALTSALPSAFAINQHNRIRTGQEINLDFTAGGGGPYKVQASVKITDSAGKVTTSTIEYVVDDTPANTNIRNTRYDAATVLSGEGVIKTAGTTQRVLKADLVDADKNSVAVGYSGNLHLKSQNADYRIVIDDLDSKELGWSSATYTVPATNRGFSHFMGLNNFFEDPNNGVNDKAAINLKVRDDILKDPNLLSVAGLTKVAAVTERKSVGVVQAAGNLEFSGALPAANDTITINGTVFTFKVAAAANDEITIGADWGITVDNIAAKLNAFNTTTSGTVDKAVYTSDSVNKINILYNDKGIEGNKFTLAASFVGAANVSINEGASSTSASGNLKGGLDEIKPVKFQPFAYEVNIGSQQVAKKLSEISNLVLRYKAAGSLPESTGTLSIYSASITGFRAASAIEAENNNNRVNVLRDAFYSKFKEGAGVNLDEELSNTVMYQNAYQASATILTTANKLFDVLFRALGY